jgi:hypothetical protein
VSRIAVEKGVLNAMLSSKRERTLTILLPVFLGLLGAMQAGPARSGCAAAEEGAQAAERAPAVGLTLAEYERLEPVLNIKNQPWTTIPWKYTITEARKVAAAAKKPIFMVVNTGNALGCT